MPPETTTYDYKLAKLIDHTYLKPNTSLADINRVCAEAKKFDFAAVCVPPCYLERCTEILLGTNIGIATVIAFPMGYADGVSKIAEINFAADKGATEVDVVINLGFVKDERWNDLFSEINTLCAFALHKNLLLKLIIEAGTLNPDELLRVCQICTQANVPYVKTSTGMNGPGANPDMIQTMRNVLPSHIQIKASGGINNRQQALDLVYAGANRLGCSQSVMVITAN
ncbi:MAG: deoxyribose-phosphate aldolase [Sphingobacteriales bacterium]|nr:deoxyribose-phosphate aldolase [Sphingobacteriales bacterium]MBP9141063.1 deoxyribose-phosphate aldolase [Chitinophagales bacterium]MDA0198285.1 deoxyribose-phosphate aldolase [Bacteroidota bacterium]MBK6890926.1 deoxyribose-phosphate aldolase [Sphingobacteriales bacterium]MBK7526024.1 deoxyribose-phosphate aldolase [Sphingobacteriales bacterium]